MAMLLGVAWYPGKVISPAEGFGFCAFVTWLGHRFDWKGQRTEEEARIAHERTTKFEFVKAELKEVEREINSIKVKLHARANKDNVRK